MAGTSEDQKLGQILIAKGLATAKQIAEAIADQTTMEAKAGGQKFKLGQLLVFKKVISPAQLTEALRSQTNKMTALRSEKNAAPSPRVTKSKQKPQTLLKRMSELIFRKR